MLRDILSGAVGGVFRVVLILFNFTRSDSTTILLSVLFYAFMCGVAPSIRRTPHAAIWVWVHLLQACTANQMVGASEDALNKPYRPIPAGLISLGHTKMLRWALLPVCLGLSWKFDVMYPGLVLAVATLLYNELGLDTYNPYTRNMVNALGIVAWEIGAMRIVKEDKEHPNGIGGLAPYVNALIIATTIHVADFRDEAGDRMQGRTTFPISMPQLSRIVTAILIISWSVGLIAFWAVGAAPVTASSFLGLGVYIGIRVFFQRSESSDKATYQLYNLWLTLAKILPFWMREPGDRK
ncbi:UbiA prenyltransferase family [Mycena crocata]|nr:UbiA prenyltransferase family [Mycena crocata]